MTTVFTAAQNRKEIVDLIRQLPGILSGRAADVDGIGRGFRVRLGFAFLSIIKEAFIVKSRGGTDEAGISWPPLSREYLAYTRPMATAPGQGSRSPPKAGGLAPGGKDGFMTEAQLRKWRQVFRQAVAHLSVTTWVEPWQIEPHAAAIAWADAKRSGVRTKLEVFGTRQVEILRDRGILFNSLSPGTIVDEGITASYAPPEDQVFRELPGELLVGTNVEYAEYHQVRPGTRPIWPKDGDLPDVWVVEIAEVAATGLKHIADLFRS